MKKIWATFVISLLFMVPSRSEAIEYPIISAAIHGGWGQNQLESGFFLNGFMRYSVEAYVPGLHFDVGFSPSFYNSLKDEEIKNPDPNTELRTITMNMRNHIAYLGSSIHIKPFTKFASIYVGGGLDISFINVSESVTDKYWDPVANEYQEEEVSKTDLLSEIVPGVHLLGGLRFFIGNFGTLDLEVRQTYSNVDAEKWMNEESREAYGDKSWNNFIVNMGLSVFIF
ncbi:hypothetical protein JXB12_10105 [candidate division KSB1 bacterium]|nr:hypothetical protein [candidate division KSB1 bacterium]